MREIKFRAWLKEEKRMFQALKIDFSKPTPMVYESTGFLSVRAWPVRYCELMQYTGLHDKNGKEIYEGDVIKSSDRLMLVYWLEGNAQFDCKFISHLGDVRITNFKGISPRDYNSAVEVIGNIYDKEN